MKHLINKTIVDIKCIDNKIIFFCNDADYYYKVDPPDSFYFIDTVLAPLPVETIIQKGKNIEIGYTISIRFWDQDEKPIKGKLIFLKKE